MLSWLAKRILSRVEAAVRRFTNEHLWTSDCPAISQDARSGFRFWRKASLRPQIRFPGNATQGVPGQACRLAWEAAAAPGSQWACAVGDCARSGGCARERARFVSMPTL
jgi:hypothetical protein